MNVWWWGRERGQGWPQTNERRFLDFGGWYSAMQRLEPPFTTPAGPRSYWPSGGRGQYAEGEGREWGGIGVRRGFVNMSQSFE